MEDNPNIDNIFVCYGGEDLIDAQLLADSINNVVQLLERSHSLNAPEIEYRLKIQAFRPGSFLIEFLASTTTANFLNSVSAIGAGVIFFLKLLRDLEGRKIVKAEKNIERSTVRLLTEDNESIAASINAYMLLLDQRAQNRASELFESLSEDGSRDFLSMSNNEAETRVGKCYFKKLASPQSLENLKGDIITTRHKNHAAIIKPDLSGASKWTLYTDKRIYATIEDKAFIAQVHDGTVTFKMVTFWSQICEWNNSLMKTAFHYQTVTAIL